MELQKATADGFVSLPPRRPGPEVPMINVARLFTMSMMLQFRHRARPQSEPWQRLDKSSHLKAAECARLHSLIYRKDGRSLWKILSRTFLS